MKKRIFKIFLNIFMVAFFSIQSPILALIQENEMVSVKSIDDRFAVFFKTKFITIDGDKYEVGEKQIISFENSENGRKSLTEVVPEPFLSTVMEIWGNDSKITYSTDGIQKTKLMLKTETPSLEEIMTIDFLNDRAVSFLKVKHVDINGVDYILGDSWAVSYENSARGRELFAEDISEPFYSAVMNIWGDTPTVILPKENELGEMIFEFQETQKQNSGGIILE